LYSVSSIQVMNLNYGTLPKNPLYDTRDWGRQSNGHIHPASRYLEISTCQRGRKGEETITKKSTLVNERIDR
jgi:hypothetical protein